MKRLIMAYLLAPLMPTIYYAILFEVINRSTDNEGYHPFFMIAIFSLPLSYYSCLVGGTLLVYFLNKKKALTLPSIVAGGVIMGAIFWYFFAFIFAYYSSGYVKDFPPSIAELLVGAAFGLSVALPFGLIAGMPWKIRRPKN